MALARACLRMASLRRLRAPVMNVRTYRPKAYASRSELSAHDSQDDMTAADLDEVEDELKITKEEDEEGRRDGSKDGYLESDDDLDKFEDFNGDPSPSHRLGKHLLRYSRVTYRHITVTPEWFKAKQAEVVAYRSPGQIRKCLKSWMLDTNQFEVNQKFLKKPLEWREDDIASNKASNIKAYGPDEAVAYAHYLMPGRFAITRRVLEELKLFIPNFQPNRIIDFGCGPGTAGAASKEVFELNKMKYTGVDMSRAMLDSAKIVLEGSSDVDCTFWEKIGDVVKRAHASKERFDLGFLTYTLSELSTDVARRAAVQVVFELLDVGGCLVIVENGSPAGSHTVRTARQFILDTFNPQPAETDKKKKKNDESKNQPTTANMILPFDQYSTEDLGAMTIAPCTHDKKCPLGQGMYCSFSQKVLSGMIRKESEEKFSYVIVQKVAKVKTAANIPNIGLWTKPKPNGEKSPSSQPTPKEVLTEFLKSTDVNYTMNKLSDEVDWEEYDPPMHREEWARIIRSPMKAKGHITMDTCSPKGRIQRSVFSRSNVLDLPSLFVAVRKTTWGGIFPSDVSFDDSSSRLEQSPVHATKKRSDSSNHPFSRDFVKTVNKDEELPKKSKYEAGKVENQRRAEDKEVTVSSTRSRRQEGILNTIKNMKKSRAPEVEVEEEIKKPIEVIGTPLTGLAKTLALARQRRKENK